MQQQQQQQIGKIERHEILAATAAGRRLVLLEALGEQYWRQGHLPGAIAMPLDRVEAVASSTLPDKSADLVVYCASVTCQNSEIAARKLRSLGYANVRVYAGGKADWADAGQPLETAGGVQ